MKKLVLSLIIATMLTGCVSEPVKQEEVATTVETTATETKVSITDAASTDISDTNNIQVQQDETSILRDRIADIVYSEYLLDCESEQSLLWFNGMHDDIDPTSGKEFVSATCGLIDLTGDGEDEIIIQKQIYGGLMYTEVVVYSIKENNKLLYLYRPGIGFNLYRDSNNNIVMLIENYYHHDSEMFFFKFHCKNQSEQSDFFNDKYSFSLSNPFVSENVSLMYFHASSMPYVLYESFDGVDIVSYNDVEEYDNNILLQLNKLENYPVKYTEFQLLNTDFKSLDTLKSGIERCFVSLYVEEPELTDVE